MTKKLKFLVCVNEKEHSKVALRFACARASVIDGEVEMLYVINPVDYNTIFSVADVIKKERRNDAEKLLKDLSEDMFSRSKIRPKGIIREGMITDIVCSCIEEDKSISMLTLGVAPDGSSGKTGLLSNLSSEIGNRIHIPLLIVPGNLTDKEIAALI